MGGMCTALSFCPATSGEKRRKEGEKGVPGGVERLDEEGPMTGKIKLVDWGQEEDRRGGDKAGRRGRVRCTSRLSNTVTTSDRKHDETKPASISVGSGLPR